MVFLKGERMSFYVFGEEKKKHMSFVRFYLKIWTWYLALASAESHKIVILSLFLRFAATKHTDRSDCGTVS